MIYSAGQNLLTREQLREIPISDKKEGVGNRWAGVAHGELADAVVGYLDHLEMPIIKETWYCNPNQSALYGAVDIDASDSALIEAPEEGTTFSLGVRHDNAGKYAVSLALGARVTVCSNGLFSGDFVLKKKHEQGLDVKAMVCDGIETWLSETDRIGKMIRFLRRTEIDDREASYIILQSARSFEDTGCISWSHLENVAYLWKHPSHEDFKSRTLWSLYNSFTEIGKAMSPPRQMQLLKGLKAIMCKYEQESLN